MSTNTNMSKRLENRVAVVTGASKGIGAAIAVRLAREGAAVVVNYARSRKGADQVVSEITSGGGRAVAVPADVSRKEDIERLFAEARRAFGPVDVLVNNAGVYEFASLEAVTPEHFHRMFDLNVLGLLLTTQEAVKQVGPNGASIINISSVVSTHAPAFASVYSATKGAIDTVTRSLAKELAGRKVRVNAVNPGLVETEGTVSAGITEQGNEFRKLAEDSSPLGRIGRPADIAPAVAFLASDESSWMTGETVTISGGMR